MAIELEVFEKVKKPVKYLKADCGVRYWEDAVVNGVYDVDGDLIPCRLGNDWRPLIELETGQIVAWPAGTVASVHYKVCDAGIYTLLDANMAEVKRIDGYVPAMMSPKQPGYGDYVIMDIDAAGKIDKWQVSLEAFNRLDLV